MRGLIRSILTSLWFMALTLPIVAIKVDAAAIPPAVAWDFSNVLYIGVGSFILSFVWRAMLARKGDITPQEADMVWLFKLLAKQKVKDGLAAVLALALAALLLFFAWGRGLALNPPGAEAEPTYWLLNRLIDLKIWLAANFAALLAPIFAALCAFYAMARLRGQKKHTLAAFKQSLQNSKARNRMLGLAFAFFALIPLLGDSYQINVTTFALLWVVLGLGLNIVVGQAGLLVLGYVAFYAIGAYTYAILNSHYGLGFWALLPVGALAAVIFGLALGFPVLRLRGDYLAIVTLGFGEIVRLVLENWSALSEGAKGIDKIPPPGFFGLHLTPSQNNMYMYYLAFLLAIFTIFAVRRLRDSRIGMAWMALREDEIACEAMGIDKTYAKLSAFAIGACWAGLGGVLFAAKTAYVHPASFTFLESATILSVVVLGGLGSTLGVVLGAFIIVLLPEALRSFSEYRMLIFGASMVLMMVFRPQGLIKPERKLWRIDDAPDTLEPNRPDEQGGPENAVHATGAQKESAI